MILALYFLAVFVIAIVEFALRVVVYALAIIHLILGTLLRTATTFALQSIRAREAAKERVHRLEADRPCSRPVNHRTWGP